MRDLKLGEMKQPCSELGGMPGHSGPTAAVSSARAVNDPLQISREVRQDHSPDIDCVPTLPTVPSAVLVLGDNSEQNWR